MKHDPWKILGDGGKVAVAAWLIVFAYNLLSAPRNLLVEAEAHAKQENDASSVEIKALSTEKDSLKSSVAEAKTACAVKDGINQTLQKQNRDQQSTIDGCLSQAMKLLTPEALKITPVFFDNDTSNAVVWKSRWILLTNKTVTPVSMVVSCNAVLDSVDVSPIGGTMMGSAGNKLGPSAWGSNIQSPAWAPTAPLLARVSHRGRDSIVCSFNLR